MKIVIFDYGAGNVFSVAGAVERCGFRPLISSDPDVLSRADKILFPGVGHAESAMQRLKTLQADQWIPAFTRPFLGICLGMQIMATQTEESALPCLNIVKGIVRRFLPGKIVPHMGWNDIFNTQSPLFQNIPDKTDFYFVHSYALPVLPETSAFCEYEGEVFSAAIQKNNFFGVQFHPEKSDKWGLKVLENFLKKT